MGRNFVAAFFNFLNQFRQPLGNPPEDKESGFTAVLLKKVKKSPRRVLGAQRKRVPGISRNEGTQIFRAEVFFNVNREYIHGLPHIKIG
jgi:hypothetical protein